MTLRILYLHGFASGPSSQKAQFFRERFERQGVEVIVPDLTGGNFEGLTISGQLRLAEQAARGEPVSLMGSSMGGYLAALYAARHPEASRLVLLAPAFGFARRWQSQLGQEQTEKWKHSGFLSVYHYGDQRVGRVGYGLIEDGLQYEDYPEFDQPALLIHGRKDAIVPYNSSVEFASTRRNVRLCLLESDHQLLDSMETIWLEASRFLREEP